MFLGREKETELIKNELKKQSTFVIVYGTRRVGKTALLVHALKNSTDRTIFFECTTGTMGYNVKMFLNTLRDCGLVFDEEELTDFDRIFHYLNGFDETINVVIDEYPFLKKSSEPHFVDSVFQNVADRRLKNIRLFLSGSDVGMMKELGTYDNALFGRASLFLELKQWDYKEASVCYPDLSPYDKVAFYSVFGGTPFLSTAVDPAKTLKENIIDMYLSQTGVARTYTTLLLMTGSATVKDDIEPILETLGNGKCRYSELKKAAHVNYDTTLTKLLDTTLNLEIIRKVFPINKPGDAKKAYYEISDNVLRFYYTYIYPNYAKLESMEPDRFYDRFIAPSVTNFVSRRFEEICRTYFRNKAKAGEYSDAVLVGTFWFDDPVEKVSGEYDVAVKKEPYKGIDCYDIYEAKYYSDTLMEKTIRRETEDIMKIKGLRIQNIGFVSVNGFEQGCTGILVSGEDLYK